MVARATGGQVRKEGVVADVSLTPLRAKARLGSPVLDSGEATFKGPGGKLFTVFYAKKGSR